MADEADGSALDPAGRVQAGDARARLGELSPGLRRSGSRRAARRTARRRRACRSSRPRDRPAAPRSRGTRRCRGRRRRPSGSVRSKRRPSTRPSRAPRRASGRSAGAAGGSRRSSPRSRQLFRMRSMTLSWLFGRRRRVGVGEVLVVDDDVDVGHLAELAQLDRGELDVGGAAASEDVHVGDGGGLEPAEHVVGDLGRAAGRRRASRARARRRAPRCRCR